jgi:hypothetical protein
MFALNPLLAAGGTAISVLFLVIAFISWLWNVINGNQNNPAAKGRVNPQPNAGRGQGQDLQAEINRFLKNIMEQKQGGGQDDLEVLVAEEVPEPPPPRKRQKRIPSAAREKAEKAQDSPPALQARRPGGQITQRKGPGSADLGAGVRQHVAEHMQEGRVRQHAQEMLAHGVAEKVQKDLGVFTAAEVAPPRQQPATVTAADVVKLIRDPLDLKRAFALNLILTRRTFHK